MPVIPAHNQRISRLPLVACTLLCLLFGATAATPAFAATSAYLEADGESGTVTPPWSSSSNGAASAAAAKSGSGGYVVNSTNAPGYLTWSTAAVEQKRAHFSVRTWVQLRSRGAGQSVDLVTVTNATSTHNFDLFVTADTGRFKWDLHNANSGSSSFAVVPGQWYFIEAFGYFGAATYTASVRIDGVDQGSIASPGRTPSAVKALWLGTTGAKTHEQWYDDVALRVADSSIGYLGAPVVATDPPVVQTGCISNKTYRLTGTVAPNGPDTTYAFEWGAGPDYGHQTPATTAGGGSSAIEVSADIAGAPAASELHYRLVATNSAGTAEGPDRSFVTASDPADC